MDINDWRYEILLDSIKGVRTRLKKLEDLTVEPKAPEPKPITCCGEWTWCEDNHAWRRAFDGVFYHPDLAQYAYICQKCRRMLLENGEVSKPWGLLTEEE